MADLGANLRYPDVHGCAHARQQRFGHESDRCGRAHARGRVEWWRIGCL